MGGRDHRELDQGKTADLIQGAKQGDPAAVDVLFERYLPIVRQLVALRMDCSLRELADREDIVQESMLDAFRGLDAFAPRSEGSFRNWLARLVENNLRDAGRRGAALRRGAGRVRRFSDYKTGLVDFLLNEGAAPPSQALRAKESEYRLQMELRSLEPRERQIIELRCLCEMSYAEICQEMSISQEGTARSLFHRAAARLTERLERE